MSSSSQPTLIFVQQPDQFIDSALKSQHSQKPKAETPFDLSILESCQSVKIARNFRKFVDPERFKTQHPDYYKIDSEFVKEKFQKLLDGIAEITVEVRSDEGQILNEESKTRILKISLFNEESLYFSGYHYACLFLEENEQAYFIFDDSYTAPQSFTKELLQYESDIERQQQNKIYFIKLIKLRIQQRKREYKEGQELSEKEVAQIKEEEHEKLKETLKDLEEKKIKITEELYRKDLYKQAFEKYKKLQLNTDNQLNRFLKFIEANHEDIKALKQLHFSIGQNKMVSSFKAQLFQQTHDEAELLLAQDPKNQKNLYFYAKSLFKLSYFDRALIKLQEYVQLFPEDKQTLTDFTNYITFCQKKMKLSSDKEKTLYPQVFEKLENEEQEEHVRKLNIKCLNNNQKKDKEMIINKILNKDGYEFNTDTDLLSSIKDTSKEREDDELCFQNKQQDEEDN